MLLCGRWTYWKSILFTFVNMWTIEWCTIQVLLMCLRLTTYNCGYDLNKALTFVKKKKKRHVFESVNCFITNHGPAFVFFCIPFSFYMYSLFLFNVQTKTKSSHNALSQDPKNNKNKKPFLSFPSVHFLPVSLSFSDLLLFTLRRLTSEAWKRAVQFLNVHVP